MGGLDQADSKRRGYMTDFLEYVFIVAWIIIMCTFLVTFLLLTSTKESEKEMNKEKMTQDDKTKQLLDELSKMSPMVVATAYVQATNYTAYGEDVTEKWTTAIQNSAALEKAYNKGYYDALQRLEESEAETEDKK